MSDYDDIPVRLPSGSKAIVRLPRPFTTEDAKHLMVFLANYIEDKEREQLPSDNGTDQGRAQADSGDSGPASQ